MCFVAHIKKIATAGKPDECHHDVSKQRTLHAMPILHTYIWIVIYEKKKKNVDINILEMLVFWINFDDI